MRKTCLIQKKIYLVSFGLLFLASTATHLLLAKSSDKKAETIKLDTDKKRISATLGEEVGGQLKKTLGEVDLEVFTYALKRAIEGGEPLLSQEEKQQAMKTFQEQVSKKMQAQAEENKKQGETFLTKNKKATGIKTTTSGLQYKVLKKGKGSKPTEDAKVSVHYEGKLLDQTVFDSSYKRNEPASFKVNQVIPGWTEALKLMSEGSEWELYIPSNLAYGERSLPNIPANSVLVFKVALLSIEKPEAKASPEIKAKTSETKKKPI